METSKKKVKDIHVKLNESATQKMADILSGGKTISKVINELINNGKVVNINDSKSIRSDIAYLHRDLNVATQKFTESINDLKAATTTSHEQLLQCLNSSLNPTDFAVVKKTLDLQELRENMVLDMIARKYAANTCAIRDKLSTIIPVIDNDPNTTLNQVRRVK